MRHGGSGPEGTREVQTIQDIGVTAELRVVS
jgi:hypothetical protein